MPVYRAPLDDYHFVIHELLEAEKQRDLPSFEDLTRETIDDILANAAKFCEEVLQPLNQSGDEEGCHFENGVVRLLGEIERRGLANVRIFMDDARLLLQALPDRALGRVFILFPDPWPKLRHHKRRMVAPATLDQLARTMKEGAELRLATDDPGYLRWMLELAPVHPAFQWLAQSAADWRERPEDWPQSRYERKAIAAGRTPYFLRFARRAR
jgi:tRNA (guanine-N7-)-methyltransferase